jgi:hypothetical protein
MEHMRCLHFVGFKDPEQITRAARIFGPPDFIHRWWDYRAKCGGERGPLDVFVFARGDEYSTPNKFSYNDSEVL